MYIEKFVEVKIERMGGYGVIVMVEYEDERRRGWWECGGMVLLVCVCLFKFCGKFGECLVVMGNGLGEFYSIIEFVRIVGVGLVKFIVCII